jgi:hypothetical protein
MRAPSLFMTISHHQRPLYDQFRYFSMTGESNSKSENIMNSIVSQRTHQYSSPLCLQNRLTMSNHSNDYMTSNIVVVKSYDHSEKFKNII